MYATVPWPSKIGTFLPTASSAVSFSLCGYVPSWGWSSGHHPWWNVWNGIHSYHESRNSRSVGKVDRLDQHFRRQRRKYKQRYWKFFNLSANLTLQILEISYRISFHALWVFRASVLLLFFARGGGVGVGNIYLGTSNIDGGSSSRGLSFPFTRTRFDFLQITVSLWFDILVTSNMKSRYDVIKWRQIEQP